MSFSLRRLWSTEVDDSPASSNVDGDKPERAYDHITNYH
jgi:hypothetical protein